jgi:hypothetical protein
MSTGIFGKLIPVYVTGVTGCYNLPVTKKGKNQKEKSQ